MDWKTEDGRASQTNLQTLHHPRQHLSWRFRRNGKACPKTYLEMEGTKCGHPEKE